MRKGNDGGKKQEKKEGGKEKNDENSDHYVIASSRPLERRTLVPKRIVKIAVHLLLIAKLLSKPNPNSKQL